jgi:glycosyltransferase involved in cell wall biosynthesis
MAVPYRVLYFARAPFVSGAERALMTMLRELDRRRFEPELILGCESELVGIARSLEIPVRIIPMPEREARQLVGWWRSCWAVERELARFRPHLVHANDVPSCQAMSAVAGRRRIPRVVHIRWPIDAVSLSWWARAGCEQILCVSRWTQEQLGDRRGTRVGRANVEVLHDAVAWTERSARGREVRTEGEAAGEERRSRPCLGFAGQIAEVKGLDLVIRALARLPADRRPRLLVAGRDTQTGGVYQRQLQQLAAECGVADSIEWLGFLDDVGTLYRRVDAVVCPARVEPLGLVPLEAAEYAVPALANAVGGLREIVVLQETGYLIEPTVAGWAAVLGNPKTYQELPALGNAAQQRVRSLHSTAEYQQRLTGCYIRLIGRSPAGE